MSTYLYLTCLDHDPPLLAQDESGQHLYDLPRIRIEINNREIIVENYDNSAVPLYFDTGTGHFSANSAFFLSQHRKCNIGITSEYGVSYV